MKTAKEIISDNRSAFEHYLYLAKNIQDDNKKILLLKMIASFATFRHTGYFSSNEIESQLIEISNKINFGVTDEYVKKNSFLHVMTRCYKIGGHTRVVERWINNSPIEEEHSIVLTAQGYNEVPHWLHKASEGKNGKIFFLREKNEIANAMKLHAIASRYEYIILHIHPCDVIPILAFGVIEFKRPVILFNHADHIFWLGVSIADIVAEIRTSGKILSLERRGVKRLELLSIPIEYREKKDKIECRKKNNLPLDAKIILSIGSPFKYRPFEYYNFIKFALNLLDKCRNAIFIIIGPNKKEKIWKDAYQISQGRLDAIGTITNSDIIDDYRCSADLYIESFPFGSSTALLDTGIFGIPVLSLSTEMDSLDIAIESGVQCKDTNEMMSRAIDILNGKIIQNLRENIIKNHCSNGWIDRLKLLISCTPRSHSLTNFESVFLTTPYDKYLYFLTLNTRRHFVDPDDFFNLTLKEEIFFLCFIYRMKMINNYLLKERLIFYLKKISKIFFEMSLSLYKGRNADNK